MERRQKAGFLSPKSSKITVTKKKERRKRKNEGKEKAIVALLVFIISNLEVAFGRKKLLDPKGPFGDNVIKIRLDILSQEYLSATKQLSTMKKP